jgi:DNA-binding LacI/PurR family transcriptional regulator
MAIGVMRQAYEHQISIPLELSVLGFDDIWLSQFTIPPLTTVEMSQAELAKLAFGALIADVERDSALARCHEYGLATHLVLRKTPPWPLPELEETLPQSRSARKP